MCNKPTKSICFLTDVLIMGGVEKVLIDCLKYLHHSSKHANDIELFVYVLNYADKKVLEMLPPNAKIIECNLPNNPIKALLMNTPYISRLFYNKIFKGKKFDCVITLKPEYLCAAYSSAFRKKIHWYHADCYLKYADKSKISLFERIKKLFLKSGLKKCDMVWTVSPSISQKLQTAFSLNNIHALPNPINCSAILEKSNDPCDIRFDENCCNIICIGRLSHEKGFDRIIKAFSDKRLKESNAHVYFIGAGIEKDNLKALVEENGLNDKFDFLGIKTNPYPYLKQASLLICPSRDESFGLTIFEAMVLSVPVISTATLGGKYVTQNGTIARMIANSDSSDELTEQIVAFVDSNSSYGYSLDKAKEWAEEHDFLKFGENFSKLLNDNL